MRVALLDGVPLIQTIWMLLQEIVELSEGASLEQDERVIGAVEELLDICDQLDAESWPVRRFLPQRSPDAAVGGWTNATPNAFRPSVRPAGYVALRDEPGQPDIGWSPAWAPTVVLRLVAGHLHQVAQDPVSSLITDRLVKAVDRLWPVPPDRWCDDLTTAPPSARTAVVPRPGEVWPPPPEEPPF